MNSAGNTTEKLYVGIKQATKAVMNGYAKKAYVANCVEPHMRNEFVKLCINDNGSIDITDKRTGAKYTNLLSLTDDGEIGDGWYHAKPAEDTTFTTKGGSCKISRSFLSPTMGEFKIKRELEVPESIVQDTHSIKRSEKTVVLKFTTTVQITENSDIVKIKTSF